jgi:hypothetical protein
MKAHKNRVLLLTFGLGGHQAYLAPEEGFGQGTISGYDSPESFWRNRRANEEDDYEGAVVIDKCGLLNRSPKAVALVMRAPMVDTRLKAGECTECPDLANSLVAQAVMSDPGNGFGQIARYSLAQGKTDKRNGLDSVSVEEYTDYWRAAGARIGKVVNGSYEWEDSNASSNPA